jgi:iron complex transport system substrate-binding protein
MTLLLDPHVAAPEIHDDISRRELIVGGAAAATLFVAGCGRRDRAQPSPEAGDGFPVAIEHRYGRTTIPSKPARVVTAGFNDSDYALAFGVVPVGVRDFIGPFPEENRRWAQKALDGAEPPKVSGPDGELNFEAIAGLRPDLIVAYSYLEEAEYRRLGAIAPTVVEGAPGSPWPEHTLVVGRALGQQERAHQLVAGVEGRFADARSRHPELTGKTVAVRFGDPGLGTYYLLEPSDPRTGVFLSLGLKLPAQTGEISRERVDLLDQDVIVAVGAPAAAYQDDALFQGLRAVRGGRVVYMGGFETEFAGALGFDSPLSLPVAVDIIVPELAAALDGDAGTRPRP